MHSSRMRTDRPVQKADPFWSRDQFSDACWEEADTPSPWWTTWNGLETVGVPIQGCFINYATSMNAKNNNAEQLAKKH